MKDRDYQEVKALIDDDGNIFVAEKDLEKKLQQAEEKLGGVTRRNLLDNARAVDISGISFRYIASNKEWQE